MVVVPDHLKRLATLFVHSRVIQDSEYIGTMTDLMSY